MDNLPDTQSQLLLRVQNPQDRDAWQEFCVTYQSVILRMCRRRGLQEADADDLTQKILATVSRRVSEFEVDSQRGHFRSWLTVVVKNAIIDHLRTLKPDRPLGGSSMLQRLHNLPASAEAMANELHREHRRQIFREAAVAVQQQVDAVTWDAFWQTAVELRSVVEVAAKLRQSTGAIYAARSRVMKRLRQYVDQREEQHAD